MGNPLAGNPLRSRSDLQRAIKDLFDPLLPFFSSGDARVKLSSFGASFGEESESLEGFARPLYGIIPLAVGGGEFSHWGRYLRGLEHGTDPDHPEFWGLPQTDQRLVEMAALGMALAFVPEKLWEPLEPVTRQRVVAWLSRINQFPLVNNNWQFFRVLVNLGFRTVGAPVDEQAERESLELLESHYQGDGYYHDGERYRIDHYVAWAYHTYGLIYASSPAADPVYAERYRERACAFAERYQYWFDARGASIPFGRSQTYRFAQGAFWAALVFAGEEALPWSRIKGLYLRHIRYWATLPIGDRDKVINLGYAYSNPHVCEPYSSACSPYWCMKYFLALGAPAQHPFWQVEEESAESFDTELARTRPEPRAGMVFQRGPGHAVMLNAGQEELNYVNTQAKYAKFAYSSAFGFSISMPEISPHHGTHDSMLALREPAAAGQAFSPWRVRVQSTKRWVRGGVVYSSWEPWQDVQIDTWLIACADTWHLRIHRIRSARALVTAEYGFALGRDSVQEAAEEQLPLSNGRGIALSTLRGTSAIVDAPVPTSRVPSAVRVAGRRQALPNTNLIWPRTLIPELGVELGPGSHWLGCGVFASELPRDARAQATPVIGDAVWGEIMEELSA